MTVRRSIFIFLCLIVGVYIIYDRNSVYFDPKSRKYSVKDIRSCENDLRSHEMIIEKYYSKRQEWQTSNLGSILFQNVNPKVFKRNRIGRKTFTVLIWKYWHWLKNRHINRFHDTDITKENDILKSCSVKNCKFIGNDTDLHKADAVVVHMLKGNYPTVERRNPRQRWIFLSDEAPPNTFRLSKPPKPRLRALAGMFNWTMTYRSDADIPVPYGRTVPLPEPAFTEVCLDDIETGLQKMVPYWSEKQFVTLAMVLMSNCQPNRLLFVNALRKRIAVDIHGGCSDSNKTTCPGHFKKDCKYTQKFLFYLALENASCRQYLTEKIFHNAYSKGAIPVISGPPLEDCEKLLPPHSYLHVDNFKSTLELANHLEYISNNYEAIMSYHVWRKHFAVINEHGFFGTQSFHYCRICEALNYNDDERSVYDKDDLKLFFDGKIACRKSLWV